MKKIVWLLSLCFVFIAGCGAASEEPFTVAVIPAQTIGEMEVGLEKLDAELTEKLNRDVEIELYPNYNAVVEALNYNQIDLAFLGPVTYLIAKEQSGAQAIVTQLIDGEPFYYSYMITHVDNEWNSLEDIIADQASIDFAFGSPASTSGHLIPGVELSRHDVYFSEDDHKFESVRYTGSHDITAQQVQDNMVDVGAIDSAIYHELVAEGVIDESQIKIIWTSEQLYQYPWTVSGTTDEETIQALQEAFVGITDQEILSIFGGASAFVEADDSNYQNVYEAAKEFGMLE
ncbi:phosphate/phosphite/phosphonate ABC transporter substrate-binding protein [Bacillus alkalicellulosilyticus]|uniref:phosphate/phosphite/phosphonate ABC transporter substrate-binding protein n=1 Tax=Alkalihalobacterium alkalicellulosilyticum TaxID=1912214 RepID=UPI0009978E1D|nr:phosphate/phosphite/phosphonate ABC transporter substrate-binding protein [Bacillus alkalicellulosilyticus]